jgi:perosamine synthetase
MRGNMKIPLARPDIGKDEIQAVVETMESGWVSQGKRVEQFEESFARYCGVKHGVAVSSGTAALHIALAAVGIGKGDEVITTPLSCVATTNPIIYLNANPVFVDVEPSTMNMNPMLIKKKITPKTKAILPVHLFGHPVDLDPMIEIAQRHNLYLIEDVAQAHGAEYKGRKVGSFGHISCFSFYADKIITTVEGGMALTDSKELAEKMRLLRSFGMEKKAKFFHPVLGFNYKMSDIHAAIGLVQMQKLESYIKRRRSNIDYLKSHISHHLDLKLPVELDYAYNVHYACHVRTEKKREEVTSYLEREGIETRPLLSFIPEQPPYRKYRDDVKGLMIANDAHRKGFYFSNSPLLTENELDYLASVLTSAIRNT